MIASIFGLTFLLIGLLALALQRFYSSVPAKELKRLAARGDHLAAALYRPVAFGASMRLFLWIVFGAGITAGLLVIIYNSPVFLAFAVVGVTLMVLVWLQSVRLTVHGARLAVVCAPALHAVMVHIYSPLHVVAGYLGRIRVSEPHSGLYEKSDLVALFKQQKQQIDNRIALAELDFMEHAAQFDNYKAADVAQPMPKVKLINVDESIGPILLEELHQSGQQSFLVYDKKPDHVVGTLALRDAVRAKAGGRAGDLMRPGVSFVHEDFSLRQVLEAFKTTGCFVVVVVNAFEEAVGVITLNNLLVKLMGDAVDSGFDAFEDRAAVASFRPALRLAEEAIDEEHAPQESHTSPDKTEVVQ